MLPVVDLEDEDATPLLILSGALSKDAKARLPDEEYYRDDDIEAWVLTYDGAEALLGKDTKLCADCMAGDECEDSRFPEELEDYYALDADEDEEGVDVAEGLFEKFSKTMDEFLRNVAEEIGNAGAVGGKVAAAAALLGVTLPVTKEALDAAYKKAAFKNHPDRGGSTEKMAAVNEAREILSAQL